MALTLEEASELATNPIFVAKVTAAVQRFAVQRSREIMNNPNISTVDKLGLQMCKEILTDALATDHGQKFAWAIASHADITSATLNDAQILSRVSELWPMYAGVVA